MRRLLEAAARERALCGADRPPERNSGAFLGAFMGGLARNRRDFLKLTLLTSPGLSSFGLWVEQLIAESTGKGQGHCAGRRRNHRRAGGFDQDRCFVVVRLAGDDNAELDRGVERLRGKFPVSDRSLTIASSSAPKCTAGKSPPRSRARCCTSIRSTSPTFRRARTTPRACSRIRHHRSSRGRPPGSVSHRRVHRELQPRDYFAVHAYLTQTPESEDRLQQLRQQVRDRRHVATTLGFGPRFFAFDRPAPQRRAAQWTFLQLTYTARGRRRDPGYAVQLWHTVRGTGAGRPALSLREHGRRVARVDLGPNRWQACQH